MKAQTSLQVTIGATEARTHFADVLRRVHRSKEHLIVEKGGIPVAAIIGMSEYDRFQRWLAEQELRSLGPVLAERARLAGMDEADLATSLQEDRRAIYQDMYPTSTEK